MVATKCYVLSRQFHRISGKIFVVNSRCLEGIISGYFLNASQKSHHLTSLIFFISVCVCVCVCVCVRACARARVRGFALQGDNVINPEGRVS
jgi:hypothetical protein